MRNILISILALLAMINCENNEKPLEPGKYRINGTVTGMEHGHLFLMSNGEDGMKTDTLRIENGTFSHQGDINQDILEVYLTTSTNFRSRPKQVTLFIEPSVMEMDLNMEAFEDVKLTGSKVQGEADELNKQQKTLRVKYKKELDAFESNRALLTKATTEEEKKELKWKDDELRGDLEPYFNEAKELNKQFLLNNPKSYVSFKNLIFLLGEFTQEEAKNIYSKFPEQYKTGAFAERLEKDIEDMSKGIPGAMAGDFNTVDINGKPIKLDDFKGQYLLIDFWASWCVPCRKGNPHLLDLYAKYNPKGLEILGVSDDDSNHDAWRKAVKEDGIGVWRHVLRGMKVDRSNGGFKLLDDGISGGYNISTLPTKILIGPDGIIIGRYGGGGGTDEDLDRDLIRIFKS